MDSDYLRSKYIFRLVPFFNDQDRAKVLKPPDLAHNYMDMDHPKIPTQSILLCLFHPLPPFDMNQ